MSQTTMQSLLFSTDKYTVSSARDWARRHGYSADDIDDTGKFIHLRQRPPSQFLSNSIRTIEFGKGIKARIGHLRGRDMAKKKHSDAGMQHKQIKGIEEKYRKLNSEAKKYLEKAADCKARARAEKDRALKGIYAEEARVYTTLANEVKRKIRAVLTELKKR